ncbi:MAG: PleD family two-component system response regulator [Bacteroidales bacterium]
MERKKRILLVDKLAIQTFLLQSIIIDEGYNCNVVESKDDALEFLRSHYVDVIILDTSDLYLQGISLLQELKGNSEFSNLPVLALSVKKDDNNIRDVLNKGADDYITKPFNIHDLLNKLAGIISQEQTGKIMNN